MNTLTLRSFLFVRAEERRGFGPALASGAGALLLGLGGAGRAAARGEARAFLEQARRQEERPALFVRVAPSESAEIDADLAAVMPAAPDGVFLEDSRGRASVEHLSAKLAVFEAEAGLADGATRIVALAAQSPAGVFGLGSYAGWPRRLAGLAFDEQALREAMGFTPSPRLRGEGRGEGPVALARSLLLLGAAAAGVAAIDGPEEGEGEDFAARCRAARSDGFSGKIALSAGQARIVEEIFVCNNCPGRNT